MLFLMDLSPKKYFLDKAHLTDLGVEKAAEFFSKRILYEKK